MRSIIDLKNLLYDDVYKYERNEEIIKATKERINYFDELFSLIDLNDLNSILINKLSINLRLLYLYDNSTIKLLDVSSLIEKYFRITNSKEKETYYSKIIDIYNKLKSDYQLEKEKLEIIELNSISFDNMIKSRRINSKFKFKQFINKDEQDYIYERLKKANVSNANIIIIMERIKIHNAEINKGNTTRINNQELYSLINLMEQGYEIIENVEDDNETLNNICKNIISSLNNAKEEDVTKLLEGLSFYNQDYLEYIYIKLMMHYQNEMFDTIEVLKEDGFYFDSEVVRLAKNEYYNSYMKYIIIRKFLDKLKEKRDEELFANSNNIEEDLIHLYYSTNSLEDHTKCYFVRDLMDINEEYYNKILSLMKAFKQGKSLITKYLAESNGFIEIKYDQIRIVLKSIGASEYSVMGVFIKKANNKKKKYDSIFKRPLAIVNDEYSKNVEDYYTDYITENARKGTR